MGKAALIIEDHPIFRDALSTFMRVMLGDENVVSTSSTEESLSLASKIAEPGIILMDLGLPGLNGVDAVVSLQRKYPGAAIVVVSASDDRREVAAVLRAGAKAFISKAVSTLVMAEAVRKVLSDEPLESTWITVTGDHSIGDEPLLLLTPRQRETLVYLCQGLSNKEIGLRLGLAEITVKIHISSIFRALDVVNRTQAVLAARRFGLHAPDVTA